MANVIGISDVSSKDVGAGSQLKTGNLKRKYRVSEKKKSSKKSSVGQIYSAKTKKCVTLPKLQPRKGDARKMIIREAQKELSKYPKKFIKSSRKRKGS